MLPFCFTLQSCYGHFVLDDETDDHTLYRLSSGGAEGEVPHRIACMTWCVHDGEAGRLLGDDLAAVSSVEPGLVPFGCADRFWERQVDSFVLQVEPERCSTRDPARLACSEALRVQGARDRFCVELHAVLQRQQRPLGLNDDAARP